MQDDLFRSFLTSVRLENKSEETMRTYEKCLRKYKAFLQKRWEKKKDKQAELEITKDSVWLFIQEMTEKEKLEPSTIRLYMIILKRFFEFLDREFPKMKYPKTPRKKPIFIEKEDFQKLYGIIEDKETKAMLSVAYSTAMRINELVTRRMKDLDLRKRTLFVSGKTGPESDAFLPLDETSVTDLRDYLTGQKLEQDDYIFHRNGDNKTPASTSTMTVRLYNLCEDAGLEPMSWHKIRHSRATHLREQGVPLEDIQALLRHSSINTTLIYASTDTEKLRRVIDDKNVLSKRKN